MRVTWVTLYKEAKALQSMHEGERWLRRTLDDLEKEMRFLDRSAILSLLKFNLLFLADHYFSRADLKNSGLLPRRVYVFRRFQK